MAVTEPAVPIWRIYARDPQLRRQGQIADFQSLRAILRHNEVGNWALEVPASSPALSMIGWMGGIIVTRNNAVAFSGPLAEFARTYNTEGDTVTLAGHTDNVHLASRLALPVPLGPPYTAEHDVRTGPAGTIMAEYVSANLGPNAADPRKLSGLIVPQSTIGQTITGRARFVVLIELLQELAIQGGDLGFRVQQAGSSLQFVVFSPSDLTASVRFSHRQRNLQAFDYGEQAGQGNYVYAAGGGEGTARIIEEGSDLASVTLYGRWERFSDRRDTSVVAELRDDITEELATWASKERMKLTPVDTQMQRYGSDYQLGNRVTVVLDTGRMVKDVVREVEISMTPNEGVVVSPTVGTVDGPRSLSQISKLSRVESRLARLERR